LLLTTNEVLMETTPLKSNFFAVFHLWIAGRCVGSVFRASCVTRTEPSSSEQPYNSTTILNDKESGKTSIGPTTQQQLHHYHHYHYRISVASAECVLRTKPFHRTSYIHVVIPLWKCVRYQTARYGIWWRPYKVLADEFHGSVLSLAFIGT
jgi:hypothetical protein